MLLCIYTIETMHQSNSEFVFKFFSLNYGNRINGTLLKCTQWVNANRSRIMKIATVTLLLKLFKILKFHKKIWLTNISIIRLWIKKNHSLMNTQHLLLSMLETASFGCIYFRRLYAENLDQLSEIGTVILCVLFNTQTLYARNKWICLRDTDLEFLVSRMESFGYVIWKNLNL